MTSGAKRPDTETMAERILMIDDDSRLAGMVSDYLGGVGFRLTIAGTGREGEAAVVVDHQDALGHHLSIGPRHPRCHPCPLSRDANGARSRS